jgi:hypothetical protein
MCRKYIYRLSVTSTPSTDLTDENACGYLSTCDNGWLENYFWNDGACY